MKRLAIMIFALMLGCNSKTPNDKAKVEVVRKESKQISPIQKSIAEERKPNIIYDTLVFTGTMNDVILSEKLSTSRSQLKFYKRFINAKNINKPNTITEKHTKTEIRYLGKIKDLDELNSYDVITNFQIWGIDQMLSPRGRSEVAFLNKNKIIIYKFAMPYELPEKIETNILYFTHEQTKIGISFLGGLPPILCIPEIGCY